MATITSAGVGSGLDVSGLVEQLVAAEGEPVRIRLDRKEVELQAGLSAIGTFKGAVSEFQASLSGLANPETFEALDVTSENEDVLTAIASNGALPGEYEVDIVQLAQAQKLASDAYDSDIKPLGTGSLTIQLGRLSPDSSGFTINPGFVPVSIDIDNSNSSLQGIKDAINDANSGVRASVINDGNGQRLVLSSLVEGSESSIRILVNDDDGNSSDTAGLSGLAYDAVNPLGAVTNLTETVAAQDAIVRVDGLEVSRSGNEINDVIDGIILELQPGSAGSSTRLNVSMNTDKVISSINDFVERYNELINVVTQLTGFNPETREAGPLSGDAAVRGVMSQIRRTLGGDFSTVNDTYNSLSSIGMDTQRNGTLSINNSKLQSAIEDDLQQVVQIFATSGSSDDPLVHFVAASDATQPGAYDLEVTQLATQGEYRGEVLDQSDFISGLIDPTQFIVENLQPSSFEITSGENHLRLRVDGRLSDRLELRAGEYTGIAQLIGELQEAVNNDSSLIRADNRLKVALEEGRLVLRSEKYGENSLVDIVSIAPELSALTGIAVGQGQRGENVQGRFNNQAGVGNGTLLTGDGAAKDLQVEVIGGSEGQRGQVFFTNGVAAQLNNILDSFQTSGGLFDTRTKGYNDRISDISEQRDQLTRKLEQTEERLTRQFSSLDNLLGKMRSTGEFLGRQLASLPGAQGNGGDR